MTVFTWIVIRNCNREQCAGSRNTCRDYESTGGTTLREDNGKAVFFYPKNTIDAKAALQTAISTSARLGYHCSEWKGGPRSAVLAGMLMPACGQTFCPEEDVIL